MKSLLKCFLVSVVICFSGASVASETEKVCIKYRKSYGWSKGYAVEGTVMRGSALNRSVGSFSRFKRFSTYVIVFWDEGEASIFDLPRHAYGRPPLFWMVVRDQEGREWRIKKGHLSCF